MSYPSTSRLPRVLVVDDDDLLRNCLGRVLRRVSELSMSADVGEAQGLLRERPFDIIVSDLNLPDGDGLTLLAEAARVQPAAKRFVFSGHEPSTEARRAVEGGLLAGIFRKPEGMNELVAFVRQFGAEADLAGRGAASNDEGPPRASGTHPTQAGQAAPELAGGRPRSASGR
jgi:DNA-binding NtrC family response regulator